MGMFDLVRQEEVDLRLPSLGAPLSPNDKRRANRAEGLALAVEDSRRNVQIRRVSNLAEVAQVATWAVSAVSRGVEAEAAKLPEERARLDAIADVMAAKTVRLIAEY